MRALLLSEYKKLSVVDLPTPEIADDEVLVRVRACGICGSDIHGYDGSTGRRIPPLVMGHEASGVIERVGRSVRSFKAGERVAMDSTVSCGICDFCRRGQINLCDNRTVLGVSCGDYRRHGAFAEYVAVPSRILYRLPDNLPFERAAVLESVSIAVHAVSLRVPKPDDSAVVVGSGMIGVLILQVLKSKGIRTIVAVDVDPQKLALATRMGATHTVNAKDSDVPAAVREITGG
jgi:L-iditol 2-dehydrogenase